jgi:hypothetical protein
VEREGIANLSLVDYNTTAWITDNANEAFASTTHKGGYIYQCSAGTIKLCD